MFKGLKRLIGNVFWSVVEELYEVHKHREMAKKKQSTKVIGRLTVAINPNHFAIRDIGVRDNDEEFRKAITEERDENPDSDGFFNDEGDLCWKPTSLKSMFIQTDKNRKMVENLLLTMDLHLG